MSQRRVPTVAWVTWGALAVYVGLIFYASSRPHLTSPIRFPLWDKVAHMVEFAILGFLSQRAARLTWRGGFRDSVWLGRGVVLVCGMAIAGLDELLQSMVPGRVTSAADFLSDVLGLVLGLILDLQLRRGPREAMVEGAR